MTLPLRMVQLLSLLQLWVSVSVVMCGEGWKHIPEIPAGRRAQYYLLKNDGGYKYGYDTGVGSSAKQSASADNEVSGNYAYLDAGGSQRSLQYTSGVSGFVPRLSALQVSSSAPSRGDASSNENTAGDSTNNFSFDAENHQHQEEIDFGQNDFGSDTGGDTDQHTVKYSPGPNTGFGANVGNVHYPQPPQGNVDEGSQQEEIPVYQETPPPGFPTGTFPDDSQQATQPSYLPPEEEEGSTDSGDLSYSFGYSADSHSRAESSDSQGNVQGTFSYTDPTGTQQRTDYEASDKTGFVIKHSSASGFPASRTDSPPSNPLPGYGGSPGYGESGPGDASYAFSYETADQSRKESSDSSGNVRGSYSFVANDDGIRRTVDYSAGSQTGFIAVGSHLPGVSPQGPSGGVDTGNSFPGSPQQSLIPVVPPSSDGSYAFSYNTDDHSRSESGDSSGNVKGSFSFVAKDDGINRNVHYSASPETGFIAVGSHLPVPQVPILPAVAPIAPPTSYSPSTSPASGEASPVGPDGSYSFSYNAGDHSRTESGDASGNVKGSFSYLSKDDGVNRKVSYSAGADTGFVAVGAHLPVPPQFPGSAARAPLAPPTSYSPPNEYSPPPSYSPPVSGTVSAPSADGSYSFSYNAGDHSRSESGDASGNVKGSFSYVAKDDGVNRKVEYSAGANTGFFAVGAHLPVPPQLPGSPAAAPLAPPVSYSPTASSAANVPSADGSYSFSYNAGDHSRSESGDASGNVKGSFSYIAKNDGVNRKVDYSAGAGTGFVGFGAHLPVSPQIPLSPAAASPVPYSPPTSHASGEGSPSGPGGSYSFSYDAGDHTRSESGDASGNVKGSFSYVAKDGVNRKVDYSAGAQTGFVANGAHLPNNALPQSPTAQAPIYTDGGSGNRFNIPQQSAPETNGDASYSYSYKTDSSSKQETSDSRGNVQGSFSFVDADGVSRTVQYTAKDNEGFIATGDHIPKPGVHQSPVSSPNANGFGTKGVLPNPSLPLPNNRFGTKGGVKGHLFTNQQIAVNRPGKLSGFLLNTYLPPNGEKFGYIFDTKGHY